MKSGRTVPVMACDLRACVIKASVGETGEREREAGRRASAMGLGGKKRRIALVTLFPFHSRLSMI